MEYDSFSISLASTLRSNNNLKVFASEMELDSLVYKDSLNNLRGEVQSSYDI
jgi:hypothetical protein